MLHETNKYIKEHFLQSENKLKINNIQRRILGTNKTTQLEQSGRKFLNEFNFCTHNKKSNYYFLFFNDLLIIGKPSKKSPSNFRIIENLYLENIEFQDDIKGEFVLLKIKTSKSGPLIPLSSNYKLIMKPEEKISCFKILSDYKNTLKLNPTVGFDLFKLLQREFPSSDLHSLSTSTPPSSSLSLIPLIPSIITQCIDYILFLDPNLNTEGLFRISCDNRQLSDLRNIFDNGWFPSFLVFSPLPCLLFPFLSLCFSCLSTFLTPLSLPFFPPRFSFTFPFSQYSEVLNEANLRL